MRLPPRIVWVPAFHRGGRNKQRCCAGKSWTVGCIVYIYSIQPTVQDNIHKKLSQLFLPMRNGMYLYNIQEMDMGVSDQYIHIYILYQFNWFGW